MLNDNRPPILRRIAINLQESVARFLLQWSINDRRNIIPEDRESELFSFLATNSRFTRALSVCFSFDYFSLRDFPSEYFSHRSLSLCVRPQPLETRNDRPGGGGGCYTMIGRVHWKTGGLHTCVFKRHAFKRASFFFLFRFWPCSLNHPIFYHFNLRSL